MWVGLLLQWLGGEGFISGHNFKDPRGGLPVGGGFHLRDYIWCSRLYSGGRQKCLGPISSSRTSLSVRGSAALVWAARRVISEGKSQQQMTNHDPSGNRHKSGLKNTPSWMLVSLFRNFSKRLWFGENKQGGNITSASLAWTFQPSKQKPSAGWWSVAMDVSGPWSEAISFATRTSAPSSKFWR